MGYVLFPFVAISLCLIIIFAAKGAREKKGRYTEEKKYGSPADYGRTGELFVRRILGETEEGRRYILNDYMIGTEEKSSQIDHIVVNPYGVFVIETKNYSGRIYGREDQLEWTQVLRYGKVKNKFYNPVKQNATHVFFLKQLLHGCPVVPLVVFVKNNTEYIRSSSVVPLWKLEDALKGDGKEVLSPERMAEIYRVLTEKKEECTVNAAEHISGIEQMKNNIEEGICPRCGGRLVERKGKYGLFYGCSNYPKCRFIKKSH